MKPIPLSQGKVAWVDDADYAEISRFRWYYLKAGYALRNGSIRRGEKRGPVYLHRHIMQPAEGMEVDHINGDRLLNTRANLRVVTHGQNMMNKGANSTNPIGHKGIYWEEKRQRWTARIGIHGKLVHVGRFRQLSDAVAARTAAIPLYHGEFGRQSWSVAA
jgi:hypothetical protein